MKKHFYSILRTISSIYGRYNLQNSETTESGVDNVVSSCEKIPSKHQLNEFSLGRSMVEMLGVLAIIGVLSVGAISGYSKAMMKYKMNKFATSMNELLNTSIQYTGQLYSNSNYTENGAQYFANILYKMNALPDGITRKNNAYLQDMFGSSVWPYAYTNLSGLGYWLGKNGDTHLSNEICHQLVKIAKENSSQLWYISTDSTKSGESNVIVGRYYGDSYCSKNTQCLQSMKLSDIETLCYSFQHDTSCRFYFVWK